jgi:hypothetical protein
LALFPDILNNHYHHQHLDHKHTVVFVHHLIHTNHMVLRQFNQIIMVLLLTMFYNHGQI